MAAGVIAKKILAPSGIKIEAKVTEIGGNKDIEAGLQKAIEKRTVSVLSLNAGPPDYPLGWESLFLIA
nr:hypothetical protein [Arachidicoccus ginsenosidivorans]